MINLAVIEMKDVIKYLVRITVVITITIALTRYFLSFRTNVQVVAEGVYGESFLGCLDTVIPLVNSINHSSEEKNQESKKDGALKETLKVELGMIDTIEKEEEKKESKTVAAQEEKNQQPEEKIEEAKIGVKTEVLESNVPMKFTTSYQSVKIKNETKIKLTEQMLKPDVEVNTKNILIYHTHSCESYTQSEKYKYKSSGNFRTTNKERSVIKVGTELGKYMKNYGYKVIHDTALYDHPSYNGSYGRSMDGAVKLLDKNPGTDIAFDIHRDAIGDSTYAPTVKIGDEYAAQMLFVIGSNGAGDPHDNWEQNLKFAVKVQEKANELYPGLFKPIILRNSDYNQRIAKAASIIEVGATGNTLDQCLVSMKYLAKVLSEI